MDAKLNDSRHTPMSRWERASRRKLTDEQVKEMRAFRAQFAAKRLPREHPASIDSLARAYGVSDFSVSQILRYGRYQWVTQ